LKQFQLCCCEIVIAPSRLYLSPVVAANANAGLTGIM